MDKQSAPRTNAEPNCLHCREPQPHPGAHFDGEEFTCADAMSAPRTNAADDLEKCPGPDLGCLIAWGMAGLNCRHGCTSITKHSTACEAAAALRKEPPALPAEVEAVLAKLARLRFFLNDDERWPSVGEAATLLRRYAQAVALFEQRDSERNRVAIESGVTETPEWAQGFDDGYVSGVKLNPVIEDATAALKQAVTEKDAEIARLTEIEERRAGRRFPIMQGAPKSIPWAMIAPYENYAVRNHSQTLERLAQRGGLSPMEALAVLTKRSWHEVDGVKDADEQVTEMVKSFEETGKILREEH